MRHQRHQVDRAIAEIARRQHGVVAFSQLAGLGLDKAAVRRRVEAGRLHRLHRGVYAVGHRALTRRSYLVAAVLAIGDDAALSHRSAAELWGIRGSHWQIDVTCPRALRQRGGMTLHRHPLPADEVVVRDGIRVTSPPRTLLDLAGVLGPQQLRRAYEQAEILRLDSTLSLGRLIERHENRKGTNALCGLLGSQALPAITKRELEERFLTTIRAGGLPEPRTNTVVEGLEVDAFWPAARLVVELDSRGFHLNRIAFERDRERDRKLMLAGYRVVRITWRQLHDDPARIVRDLRQLIRSAPV